MRRKRRPVLSFIILILLAAVITLVYLVSSNPRLEPTRAVAGYDSLEAFKTAKLGEAVKSAITGLNSNVDITVDQDELSGLTDLLVKELESSSGKMKFDGHSGRFVDGRIEIKLDSTLLKVLPVQYSFRLLPSVEDNKIKIHIESVKIGKLGIPAKTVLKLLDLSGNSSYYVNAESQNVYISNNNSEQFTFKDLQIKDEKLQLSVELSINNIKDLVKSLDLVLPEQFKQFLN